MGINHELAATVLQKIKKYPQNFEMSYWFGSGDILRLDDADVMETFEEGKCGTTLCVAGWVDQLTTGKVRVRDIEERARVALGLNSGDLFFTSNETAIAALSLMAEEGSTEQQVRVLLDAYEESFMGPCCDDCDDDH